MTRKVIITLLTLQVVGIGVARVMPTDRHRGRLGAGFQPAHTVLSPQRYYIAPAPSDATLIKPVTVTYYRNCRPELPGGSR